MTTRTRTYAAALAVSAALLAGCGQATGDRAGAEPSAPASSTGGTPIPAWTGDVIPDGTYVKTATRADARRLGLASADARELLGPDGRLHTELRLDGDVWSQFGDDVSETMTQGDGGTATYDADGNWVPTSASSGCPGCVATVAWSLRGDRLTLRILEAPSEGGDPTDVLISRLVMEGEYTRR